MRIALRIGGPCVVVLAAVLCAAAAPSDVADAAMKRDVSAMRTLLQQKADVNMPQPDGSTALHWATHFDDVSMVQILIGAGANVKAANRFGVTPCRWPARTETQPSPKSYYRPGQIRMLLFRTWVRLH